MVEVGLGQIATTTGQHRGRVLRDAVSDNHPLMQLLKENNGIKRVTGGDLLIEEAKMAQNPTVGWVGASGTVPLTDTPVISAAYFDWKYLMGSVTWTRAEKLKNSGGDMTKYIDLIGGKFEVLEDSMMNDFHAGLLSNGTAAGGLQLGGIAALVSTTPTTGTVGGINRALSGAAWYRNQAFNTASDWTEGAVNAGNVKRFLDKGINGTMRDSKRQVQVGFAGQTHFEYLTSAIQAIQIIQNENDTGKAGFEKLVYRGVPIYFGNGVNYSGETAATLTRTYLLNLKPGGVNLTYMNGGEFEMINEIDSANQAATSKLMFTMANMTIGGLAKLNWVGFD